MVSNKPSYMDINGKYIRALRNPFNFTYIRIKYVICVYTGRTRKLWDECRLCSSFYLGIITKAGLLKTDRKKF